MRWHPQAELKDRSSQPNDVRVVITTFARRLKRDRQRGAAAALQRNAITAIANVLAPVIAGLSYHFVIAVWRAKEHGGV